MLEHLPCRDRVPIDAPLELEPLPGLVPWSGSIAYLDRDGVLNRGSPKYINSPSELVLLPNAAEAVAKARRSGMRVAVVTNQSPIGRGLWGVENLAAIHDRLRTLLLQTDEDAVLDIILHSPYLPHQNAWARKPNPGMLEAARQLLQYAESGLDWSNFNIRFGKNWTERPVETGSVMVGDRESDLIAGEAHGVRSVMCPAEEGISAVIDGILD